MKTLSTNPVIPRLTLIAPLACLLMTVAAHGQQEAGDDANAAAGTKPARTAYQSIKVETLPRDDKGFLKPDVWALLEEEAKANPKSNEAAVLAERSVYQAYYATFANWKAPEPLPVQPGRLRNLPEAPKEPRFPITDKVWPGKPGEASVCLWEDDKLAAMSLGVDDNNAMDVPYWKELSKKYGGLNITWNIITCNIGGVISKGRVVGAGTWETWQQLLNDGYHLASHSMTHNHGPVPADGWPGPDWEAAESARMIDSHLPGHKTRAFAYPGSGVHVFAILGGYRPDSTWRPSLIKYYVAARGGGGEAITPANMIDYFNIHATTGSVPFILDANNPKPIYASQNLHTLFDANPKNPYYKNYRGWANVFIHFINAGKGWDTNAFNVAYAKILDFYNQHRADLWTGFFDDVALYGQERDTATLTTDSAQSDEILFTLTSKMEPTIFDYPLTIKVRLPSDWKGVGARQKDADLPATFLEHDGAPYALVKVVPDRGQVRLTAAGGK